MSGPEENLDWQLEVCTLPLTVLFQQPRLPSARVEISHSHRPRCLRQQQTSKENGHIDTAPERNKDGLLSEFT